MGGQKGDLASLYTSALGDTTTSTAAAALGSSGDAATAPAAAAEDHHHDEVLLLRHDGNGNGDGGGGGEGSALSVNNSAEEDNKAGGNVENGGDRSNNCGGNRWPRPETLALLKIRSDMDATFRDSSLKAPLWEEVSRKLAELGYKRSAKKCKEKFENVYKYHKRTKDGRNGKSDGKTYRFFDQIEAFDHQNHHPPPPSPQKPHQAISTSTTTTPTPWTTNLPISTSTVSHNIFATPNPTINNNSLPILPQTIITKSMITNTTTTTTTTTKNNNGNGLMFSSPTSSSTASDEEFQARHKRKRKWRDFFRRLTREVVRKQEEMQKRFLETVAKCENERTAREEVWRLQEMARINREHEILLQERSAAAAKDAAVITFLQKISGVTTYNFPISVNNILSVCDNNNRSNNNNNSPPTAAAPPPPPPAAAPASFEKTNATPTPPPPLSLGNLRTSSSSNSSSRWPKAEVEGLINLRTNLDLKYQDNMPKGPLWEEISAGMRQLGYNRSAKRCKEKWENINKYFKKVKDNNKKRSEDSKTCPYFHKLDAIYRERSKIVDQKPRENGAVESEKGVAPPSASPPPLPLPHLGMEPLMVQPERQWPLQVGNDTALDEEDEEEEYQEDEEDHRDTSSSTEMEQDHHDDRPKGNGDGSYGIDSNLQSSINVVE
ncbi:hypothetical protein TIFTF001_036907 [Ficus carica]|uniref:Myb-like domain-containing protein n=1 Tax=Ficus carica TaxID=3494 RepID=A0AA88JBS9_FICCA|nr:hypothetical protein TIFTF001_036892 [Ficus carica]GMN67837.1 hypothetical protein TIFTF001_036898 [Ficus carica]GMN67846.1 hypothetical protein TIFTF001_036901 [Ficus carica]GMN67852.1 hypothetical protein TIFTF001_036907 [Ficus carica]